MEPNDRIIINEIEIENFKSYAGRKRLGPFHESFTSIVGPNGSGKSNVIDAILFVFGYRSSKIRSKRLSLLIHSSETFPSIESCSVYVHFKRIKDGDMDPDFELTLSRTARKDNSSDYYLNGRKSSYREVAQALRDYQVDLDHNRFLILQGEVEQISLMKPKGVSENDEGLLEFLEDIIGSGRHKAEIVALEQVIDEFDGQLVEKINRVKIAQTEKEGLEAPKNAAQEYIDEENNLNSLLSLDAHVKLAELNQKDSDVLTAQSKLSEDKTQVEKKLSELETKKAEAETEFKRLEKTYNPLFKEIEKQTKLVANSERKELKLKQDVVYASENVDKIKENLEGERETYNVAKNKPVKSQSDLERLNRGKEIMECEIAEIETRIEALLPEIQKKTAHLQVEKEQKNKTLLDRAKVLSEAEVNLNSAKNSLNTLISRREQLTADIHTHKRELEEKNNTIVTKEKELKDAQKQLPDMKNQLPSSANQLDSLHKQETNVLNELSEKRDVLEQVKLNESSIKSRSKIMVELVNQRDMGAIKGIFGRLGDLGAVAPQYDCAVSSACGFLDHCLVDTMDTAVKCVEFLRKTGLGVASFIALDKMQNHVSSCSAGFECPKGAIRLFDLVQPADPAFAPAFYFAFRDTLVVNDIDAATAVAYGEKRRHRVATLRGEIVEKSGAITCGGEPIRGKIILISERRRSDHLPVSNPEQLSSEIASLDTKLSELRIELVKLKSNISHLEESINVNSAIIDKNPRDINLLNQESNNLQSVLKKLKIEYESCLPNQDELHRAQMNLEQQKKEREKTQAHYDVVEEQIRKLDNQILAVRGSIIDTHQSELVAKRRLLGDINSELSKTAGASAANERLLKKSETALKELENNLEAAQNKFFKIKETCAALQPELVSQKELLRQMEAENSGSSARLTELRSELKAFERENELCRQRLLDLKLKFDEIVSRVKSHENKVSHVVSQINKLVHRSFNDNGEEVVYSVPVPSEDEISSANRNLIHEQIREIQSYINSKKPDFGAVSEYYAKKKLYDERFLVLEEFKAEKENKSEQLREFKSRRLNEFMEGFSAINCKLKEMYQLITLGGDAELELIDSLNPFLEGVAFSVRPPNKSWKHIANLSGGEKTLSSLSLIFALHHYKPAPFYVMDEIDAALDFKNVSIVANYIKDRTQNAQFIIISLRDNMFELANRLVGIYKTDDCTKSVSLYVDQLQSVF